MNILKYSVVALILLAGTVQGQDDVTGMEKPKFKIPINNRYVDDMSLAPDGKSIAVAGGNSKITIYKIDTGKIVREYENLGVDTRDCRVAFSADGKLLAGGGPLGVKIWDVETGKVKFSIQGKMKGSFCGLAFTPNNKTLIVHGVHGDGIGGSRITVWDLPTKKLTTFPVKTKIEATSTSFDVVSFALSLDGQTLYYIDQATSWLRDERGSREGGSSRSLIARDLKTGKEKRIPGEASLFVSPPAVSPDGKTIIFGKSVLDVAKGQVKDHKGLYYGAHCYSPDGNIVVCNMAPGIRGFDPVTGKQILYCYGPSGTVGGPLHVCPAFTPDSQTVIVPGQGELWGWDISDFMKKRAAK